MQAMPAPRRHLVVGDLQGCREEFERLLERLRYDPAGDRLLLLGDLVNRGPDSLGCLRLAHGLGADCVLGNHDLHLLRSALGLRARRPDDTLDGVLAAPDRDPLLAWLAGQPLLRLLPGAVLVHAALPPGLSLESVPPLWLAQRPPGMPGGPAHLAARLAELETTPLEILTRARLLDAEGRPAPPDWSPPSPLWPASPPPKHWPYRPWYQGHRPADWGGRRAVFGHWAMQGLIKEPAAIGLDTGCVWGGGLCAWIAEEDRLVAVPATRVHAQAGVD
jgi:bis(5'-nucleosyl)-tetraphosphatase (symmetrical)